MTRDIAESDWRVLRELRSVALERLCERVLDEIRIISADSGKTFHERYQAVYGLIRRRDDDIARAFDAPRRSQAFFELAAMKSLGLLTPEELRSFSVETLEILTLLTPA
jgi:hypothetical protein